MKSIKIVDIENKKEFSFEPNKEIKTSNNMRINLEKMRKNPNNIYHIPMNEINPKNNYNICITENGKESRILKGAFLRIRKQIIIESDSRKHFREFINNNRNTKLKINTKLSDNDNLILEFYGKNINKKQNKTVDKTIDKKDLEILENKKKIGDYFLKHMTNNKKSLHSITFSTGSGKSYNAFESIIKKVQKDKLENITKPNLFLFIAPLKSQLGINKKVKENLIKNNIFVFRDLSIEDRYCTSELENIKKIYLNIIYDNYNGNNYEKLPFISQKNSNSNETNIYNKIKYISFKIDNIIVINNEIKNFNYDTPEYMKYEKKKYRYSYQKKIEEDLTNILEKLLKKSGKNFKEKNPNIYIKLINFIGHFNPFNILSIEKNILITPTTAKNITSIYTYKKSNNDSSENITERENNSFNPTGKNIFETLAKNDDNNILNKANISIFIDESTESFFTYRENYLKNVSTKFIIPELVSTFKKQININIKYKTLMQFISKKDKNSDEMELYYFLKNKEKEYKNINEDFEIFEIFEELKSSDNITHLYNLKFKNKKYSDLLKDFLDIHRFNNFNYIIEISEIYHLIKIESSKFDISENTIFDFFDLHNNSDKELYMDKILMIKHEMIFDKIFHTQSNSVFTSHKEYLNKLFIHSFDNNLEIKENKNSSISLYDYIQSVLFILNILSNNNDKSKSDSKDKNTNKKIKGYIPNILEDLKDPINETSSSNLYAVSKNLKTKDIYKKIFNDISNLAANGESPQIDKDFYFKTPKLIINIKDNGEHKNSGNKQRNSLGFYFYYQLNTVENMLIESFKYDNGNLNIFKMSATDGIEGNHYDYDDEYIFDELEKEKIPYFPYTKQYNKNSFNDLSEIQQITLDINNSRKKDIIFMNKEPTIDNKPFNFYMESIVEKFKNNTKTKNNNGMSIFNLNNRLYKTIEIENMFKYINNFYRNTIDKSALLFTQTTINIHALLENFIINDKNINPNFYIKKIEYGDLLKRNQGIYDIKNDKGKTVLRLILFKSQMDILIDEKNSYENIGYKDNEDIIESDLNWEQIMNTDNNKVLMISDYKNAGIGVSFTQNNIVNGELIEKDFDSLIFNNDVFYNRLSSIKDNHIDYFLFQSHYVQKNELYGIFNLNNLHELNTDDDFLSHLSYTESILYIIGIIQNIGRAERKDNNDNLKIYMPIDIMSKIGVFYNNLDKIDTDRMKYNSNANIQLKKEALKLVNKISLDKKEFKVFSDIQYKKYISFNKTKKNILENLNSFRDDKNNIQSFQQWEILRDIESWNKPDEFIKKLKNSNLFNIEFINSLYLNIDLKDNKQTNIINKVKKQLFRSSNFTEFNYDKEDVYKVLYSDAKHTTNSNKIDFYQFLKIKQIMNSNKEEKISILLNKILDFNIELFNDKIPSLFFLQDILAPFFLEKLLEEYLKMQYGNKKHLKIFNTKDFTGEFNFLYEFGDSFIYNSITKTLTLIDAKSWSKISDKKLSKITLEVLNNKLLSIEDNISKGDLSIEIKKVEGLFISMQNNDTIDLKGNYNIRSSFMFSYDKKLKSKKTFNSNNFNTEEVANIEVDHSKSTFKLNIDILK